MAEKKRKYIPPRIITYSADDILEELGPAQACSPFSGGITGQGFDSTQSPTPPNAPGYAPGLPPAFYEPPDKKKKL